MKGYVVTLMNLPESVAIAERCKTTGEQFGVDVELFPAVYKDVAMDELADEGLRVSIFDESFSNTPAVIGNFVTQYRIWNKIVVSGEPGIVLEHDAVFTAKVPVLSDHIVNLGKPSYGQFATKPLVGVFPMFSKVGGYIPGAHGYYLTPLGAQAMINKAKELGAAPCDLFINKTNFPNIKEVYPWVIEAKDEFTTIQKERGCEAKHNYNKNKKAFKIL